MNLGEMKTRAWVAIGDSTSSPIKLTAADALLYINQAIQDVADLLKKRKTATLTFTAGLASWPADFLEVIRIEDNGEELDPITTLEDAVESTDTTTQWMRYSASQVQIWGATPTGTVTLYYYASPAALAQDADIPSDIPARFHHYIPEVYVAAMYYLSQGDRNTYDNLMDDWNGMPGKKGVRDKIADACSNQRHEEETPRTVREVWQ